MAWALENLKNLHLNGLLLMTLNTDTTFEGKLNCAFKNDMKNYSKLPTEHVWKSKNWKFDGILLSKVKIDELKTYTGVLCQANEELYQIWTGINFSAQTWLEEFHEFWPEHSKISKIYILMGFFWKKCTIFDLKKCTWDMFGSTRY